MSRFTWIIVCGLSVALCSDVTFARPGGGGGGGGRSLGGGGGGGRAFSGGGGGGRAFSGGGGGGRAFSGGGGGGGGGRAISSGNFSPRSGGGRDFNVAPRNNNIGGGNAQRLQNNVGTQRNFTGNNNRNLTGNNNRNLPGGNNNVLNNNNNALRNAARPDGNNLRNGNVNNFRNNNNNPYLNNLNNGNNQNRVTSRRPTVTDGQRSNVTKFQNQNISRNFNRDDFNNNFARNNNWATHPNNPRHWDNWGNNWNNYGVARYQHNWYRGPWGGFYGPGFYSPFGFGYGYGGYGYYGVGGLGYRLFAWGLNPWILNSLGYRWGYYNRFNNPYYGNGYSYPYDYNQPVALDYSNNDQYQTPTAFSAAQTAFYNGRYEEALAQIDQALKQNPTDATTHEVRALTLFAMGRYDESAATLNSLLAVAPGWNWQTMSSLYPNVGTYTQQLRALEGTIRGKPNNAATRFVLAYHYLVAGNQDVAKKQLEYVLQLEPNDRVARQLLDGLTKTDNPAPPPKPADDIHLDDDLTTDLVGNWTAARKGADSFTLNLDKSGDFTWKTGDKDDSVKVSGKYELKEQSLILDGGKNDTLVGHLTSVGDDKFRFKLLGSPPDDPGLVFERSK